MKRMRGVPCGLLAMALMTSSAWAQDDGMDTMDSDAASPSGETVPSQPSSLDPQPEDTAVEAKSAGDGMAWMKDWHIGPALSVSFPHPVNYGLEVGYKKHASFGIQAGNLNLSPSTVEIDIANWDVRGRWHPFQGTFFMGLAYGTQTLAIEADQNVTAGGTTTKNTVSIEVDTVYATPHVGWIDATEAGFLYGFELGYQIANSSKAKDLKIDSPAGADPAATAEVNKLKKDVEDAAEQFGKTNLPYIGFKWGWMF